MKYLWLVLTCLCIVATAWTFASAQIPPNPQPCNAEVPVPYGSPMPSCPVGIPLPPGQFNAQPLVDGCNPNCLSYGDQDANIVSLYGHYGNNEKTAGGNATAHYNQGMTQAAKLTPLCGDGTAPPCTDGSTASIVFLFIGFSNCDIEICGGDSDAWDMKDMNPGNLNGHLAGQPCATFCPNLNNPDNPTVPWNQVMHNGTDGITQQSFLYQVYHPTPHLVGASIVIFDGALGAQSLDKWDPNGYYVMNNCPFGSTVDPECNYDRVKHDLQLNRYTEKQVQAVFLKSSDSFPQCDLHTTYCPGSPESAADAYLAETYLGNILRYLKCCKKDPFGQPAGPRYPNLQQVFITSRIYGGYAVNPPGGTDGCLSPEPFAYEEGFTVQRAIVDQIDSVTNDYAGDVRYPQSAPWFDWGPYLWASGPNISQSTGLFWCDTTTNHSLYSQCSTTISDFRYGDLTYGYSGFWGDHTHPTYTATQKVAGQLVKFIQGTLPAPQTYISDWVTGWIQHP